MNPLYIEAFLSIVEHKNISAAARASHFSQPALSEYLSQLEYQIGSPLFFRKKGSRQVALTPVGKEFLPLAEQWMAHQRELDERIEGFIHAQTRNSLRLAASGGAHQNIVSQIIYKLMDRRPGIELQLRSVEIRELPNAIAEFTFDAAFSYSKPLEHDLIEDIPLFAEPRYILCPKDTGLPDRVISARELDPAFEVVHKSQNVYGNVNMWRREHFPEGSKPFLEVSNLASIHNYLTDPRCWAIVPASTALAAIALKPDRFTYRLVEPEAAPRICHLLVLKTYPEKQIICELLQCCDEYIDERPYLERLSRDKQWDI